MFSRTGATSSSVASRSSLALTHVGNTGDIEIFWLEVDGGSTPTTPGTETWAQLGVITHASGFKFCAWYRRVLAGENGAATGTFSFTTNFSQGGIVSYSGAFETGSPLSGTPTTNTASGTSTSETALSVTTADDRSLVVALGMNVDASNTHPSATQGTQDQDASCCGVYSFIKATAGATGNDVVTVAPAVEWGAIMFALKPGTPVAQSNVLLTQASAAGGVSPASGGSAWGAGSWLDLLSAGWDFDVAIYDLEFRNPAAPALTTTYEALIEIATGPSGSETVIAQIPWTFRNVTAAEYLTGDPANVGLAEPVRVAAGTRVAVRVSDSHTAALTYTGVKVAFRELAAGGTTATRTASDTLGTSDSATRASLLRTRTAADSLGTTDAAGRSALALARAAADTLGTSDATARAALSRTRTAADTLGTTDTAARASLTRSRTASDTLGTTDSAAGNKFVARTASDSLGTTDTATRAALLRARTAGDSLGTSDAATRVVPGATVLTFDNDNAHFARFAWADIDFTGPLSVCFVTHWVPVDEHDHWMLSLYDNDPAVTDNLFEFEHSGGPVDGGEFSSFVFGSGGGNSGFNSATVSGDFYLSGKSWEIWFTWDGITDGSGESGGYWHWRNLTDAPTTWHHHVGLESGTFATALLRLIADGSLYVGGNPNGTGGGPYQGGIGFVGGWNADLYDNGSGHLGTDPIHTKTSDLQAIAPSSMRWGADLTSTTPASVLDLAGQGVQCVEITATLGAVTIPEWTFDGTATGSTSRTATDTLGTSDTASRASLLRSRSAADSLGTSDSASRAALLRARTASDSLSTTDAATRAALTRTRTASDTLGTTDSATGAALGTGRTASDTLGTTDAAARAALLRSRTAADSLSTSDSAARLALLPRTAADSLSTTDTAARAALLRARTASDILGTTDAATGTTPGGGRAAADSLGTTDAAVRAALLRARTAADSLGTTDSTARVAVHRATAADSLGTSDTASRAGLLRTRTAADSLATTDSTVRATVRYKTASDSLGTSDAATGRVTVQARTAGDSLTTSDTAAGRWSLVRIALDVLGTTDAAAIPDTTIPTQAGTVNPRSRSGRVNPMARSGTVDPSQPGAESVGGDASLLLRR